jgi:hypothetical protein
VSKWQWVEPWQEEQPTDEETKRARAELIRLAATSGVTWTAEMERQEFEGAAKPDSCSLRCCCPLCNSAGPVLILVPLSGRPTREEIAELRQVRLKHRGCFKPAPTFGEASEDQVRAKIDIDYRSYRQAGCDDRPPNKVEIVHRVQALLAKDGLMAKGSKIQELAAEFDDVRYLPGKKVRR